MEVIAEHFNASTDSNVRYRNIVTKNGGSKFEGSASAYMGIILQIIRLFFPT
jgi:hypothetical protein